MKDEGNILDAEKGRRGDTETRRFVATTSPCARVSPSRRRLANHPFRLHPFPFSHLRHRYTIWGTDQLTAPEKPRKSRQPIDKARWLPSSP